MSEQKTSAANVLEQMDNQKLSMFHIKVILLAGLGFFCDAYDLFNIGLCTNTIARIYFPDQTYWTAAQCNATFGPNYASMYLEPNGPTNRICGGNAKKLDAYWNNTAAYPTFGVADGVLERDMYVPGFLTFATAAAITSVALVGTLVGQIFWGWAGDKFGRKGVFGFTLILMSFCSLGSALSFSSDATAVLVTLCLFRFFLGFGVGGDYPLSAVLMSEFSGKGNRGALVGAVFAQQGTGYITATIVTLVVASIFDSHPYKADYTWRLILGFGFVPSVLTMYWRLNMPETPRYTALVEKKAGVAAQDMAEFVFDETTGAKQNPLERKTSQIGVADKDGEMAYPAKEINAIEDDGSDQTFMEFLKHNWVWLLGTCSTWFLLDIAYYSQSLFQSAVFSTAGWIPTNYTMYAVQELYKTARAQAIVTLCSIVPGYWMTVFTVDYIGRKPIQVGGFLLMTVFMSALAAMWNTWVSEKNTAGLVSLYALTFFFANWGPNATTFIVPSELFPARFRSTAHGISAACGKAGAIIGAYLFLWMKNYHGVQGAVSVLAGVNFVGLCFSFLIPETKGRSLEEMSRHEPASSKTSAVLPMETGEA